MSEFEGKIEETDRGLKEMRPNKDGSISWKYGLKVGGIWHSVFGSKAEVEAIKKDVDAGGNYAKGTYKLSKDGKYRNIEEVKIDGTWKNPEEGTDPSKSLAGTHQGLGKPKEEPKEEVLGVEDQETEEDNHYIKAWARAGRITGRASTTDKDYLPLRIAFFEKLAPPLVYLRENIRRARAEAGVK